MAATKKATDSKALKNAHKKAAAKVKAPAKTTAPTKKPEPVKNNITFFVSAKGTVLKSHVSERDKTRSYFQFDIEGSQLQLRWALKGTSQSPVRVLNASLAKNSADELCTRLQQKLSPGFLKILRPIFAWLIERVKNDTLDQPKIGRCWRELPSKEDVPAKPATRSFKVNYNGVVKNKLSAPYLLVELTGEQVEIWNVRTLTPEMESELMFSGPIKSIKPARYRVKKNVAVHHDRWHWAVVILEWIMDMFDNTGSVPTPQHGFRFTLADKPGDEVDALEHHQEPEGMPLLKPQSKPATENVFSTTEFVQRTKVWQLAQVTWHDALVCRKMLEKHGYDLDAAYAEFLDCAERTARKVSGSDS